MKRHLPVILLAVSVLALCGAGFAAIRVARTDRAGASFATATVARKDLRREVSFIGTVVPSTDADLAFERGGTVAYVGVKAGDKVVKGQILASLSAADLAAQVAQARAGVAAAQAKLEAMKRGARPEALAVQDAQVAAAESALDEARGSAVDRITDAYAKADDAVRGKTDAFFVDPLAPAPRLSFDPLDARLSSELGSRRFVMEETLRTWNADVSALSTGGDITAATSEAKDRLNGVSAFLADCAHALDQATTAANPGISQISLDGYKAGVSAARANVNAVIAALSSGGERIRNGEAALTLARSQRALGAAPATAEDVAVQEAVISQAQAAADAAAAQLAKTALRSPVSGTVASVRIALGETAVPSVVAVSVLSGDRFEIDALASETQIASFAASDEADVTLDAYGNGVPFKATVARIDPAPTTKNGETGYPVIIRFNDDDARVKVGMTANAHIGGATHAGALSIPRSALLNDADGASVLLRKGGRFVRTPVKTGISAQDAVEITDGLTEGDIVADLSVAR